MAGKRLGSEVRRVQILNAATAHFLAHGYETVSIDSIIADAGGTKTNVYSIFGDKAALFAAVVEQLAEEAGQSLAGIGEVEFNAAKPESWFHEVGYRYASALLSKRSLRAHRLVIAEAGRFPAVAKLWTKKVTGAAIQAVTDHLPPATNISQFFDLAGNGLLLRQLVAGAKPVAEPELKRHVDQAVAMFLKSNVRRS